MDIHSLSREYVRHIDDAFSDLIEGEGLPPDLFVGPGIPRIRPTLLLLSACATQRVQELDSDDMEHVALSVEMCAAAIAIHDAALGQQGGLRRRVARKVLGRVRTLAGNQLFVRAVRLMTQVSSDSAHLGELLSIFSDVFQGSGRIEEWKNQIPTSQELLEYHLDRNIQLFSFVCRSGARIAGAEPKSIGILGRYGTHVGMAWLIAEELFWLLESKESALQFVRAQANHYESPYILTIQKEEEDRPKLWSDLCQSNDLSTAEEFYHTICTRYYFQESLRTVVEFVFKAESTIRGLEETPHREALIAILHHITDEIKERIQEWEPQGQL
ncbi:MAG: hypothetical protein CL916_02025 [Deltaproteobacteria bacterium]|nr:hypothetical protein [Deltaproteobacteria bacterium]